MNDIFQVVRRGTFDAYLAAVKNVDINILADLGESLLHEAISSDREDVAEDLIQRGIDVNIKNTRAQTALHYLGFHPNANIAESILRSGGDISSRDVHGNTALWYAVSNPRRDYELVRILLRFGADVYSKNKAGRSPLDIATQFSDRTLSGLLEGG